jgi:transcriptional regulator with XRE-family HTH domain
MDMNGSDILKQARKESGMSQKQLAKNLDISQTQVSRYEKNPESIPAGLFSKWTGMFGLDPADVFREDTGASLRAEPGDPYAEFQTDLDLLSRYIDMQAPDTLEGLSGDVGELDGDIPSTGDLKQRIRELRQKPSVMTAGGFDTGKSYLANTLMGKDVLPTSFQPATRVVTVVRHVDDRPDWQDEDVWLFEESLWKTGSSEQVVDVSRLDEQSCRNHRVLAGSHDLLGKYGVHRSEPTEKVKRRLQKAHSAVVYADAPVLKACNLIDLPGFGDRPGESTDQQKAESALPFADVVLYASRIAGHLSGKDLARISSILRRIPAPEARSEDFPTLGNFFIAATHADRNVSEEEWKSIRDNSTRRLHRYLSDNVLSSYEGRTGRSITVEDLRAQWFPFWGENEDRSRGLVDRLEEILGERLPAARIQKNRQELTDLKEEARDRCRHGVRLYRGALQKASKQGLQLKEPAENGEQGTGRLQKKRQEVLSTIETLKKESRSEARKLLDDTMSEGQLKWMIEENFDSKSRAKDRAPALVVESIESEIESLIGKYNGQLSEEVDEYLDTYEEYSVQVEGGEELSLSFDARGAFAGGLTGVATAGALSAWASQLGALGGYAIVAQGVSALSALGISISGGAAAVSAWVAALGGPITLGAAVAGVTGLAGWRLLSQSWEERLAKKLASHFQEKGLREEFLDGISEYWDETREAFEAGADEVEEEFESHLAQLKGLSGDDQKAERLAKRLEDAEDFYSGMPV